MIATLADKQKVLRSLSDVELNQLRRFAYRRLRKCADGLSLPDLAEWDLVNDAIIKMLASNDRPWDPDRVKVVPYLCGVIRSMTSNEVATQVNHRPEYLRGEAAESALANYPSSIMAPDGELEARQEKEWRTALSVKFYDMLDQDPVAAELYELKCQGLKGPAIQQKLNMSKKEYVRRDQRLRRVYDSMKQLKAQGKNDE
ncbi:MAG: hypothetical protein Q8N00_02055 [Nitrospirota bacterium]|nr:hypothetical protein [Nitrospirota bacterium]